MYLYNKLINKRSPCWARVQDVSSKYQVEFRISYSLTPPIKVYIKVKLSFCLDTSQY